ncbi:ALF repeat-containing protein [Corynebacterium epidermidicanis]|uniref:Putative secreted protein n=1 Tax=Corynebacterium epidermidicanis TaxID=1050174 RepID=A0A0G3GYL0_9CORY|nr:ALF repeat-containing protein [Corynebacterium epidermidicanis]AKK03957.1 putative secreted protein [Corynebacterium epidermidicanis]
MTTSTCLHHNKSKPWVQILTRILTAITVIALASGASNPAAIAQTDQIRLADKAATMQQAREFALEMLQSTFPASKNAAEAALRGGDKELQAYASVGMDEAKRQDLSQILVTISTLSGKQVQQDAAAALATQDVETMAKFIDSGWQQAQTVDDRATAWDAAKAPEGSSLKAAADQALKDNTAEALSEFASHGADTARAHDARREVYELTRSALPSVAAGASEAIRVGTDTAVTTYLRYGQFVDAAQDMEEMDISALVEVANTQSVKAEEAASVAAQHADGAKRATELSKQATERAKNEAIAADGAQIRAGNAAAAAGQLATQSAASADNAVAAAAEAKQALAQTADALSRAAAAAATARMAANEAAARASAAGLDANMAYQARVAAEQARDAASRAEAAAASMSHAEAAAGYARNASGAAASAAMNADASAAAAEQAAAAAGAGDEAAADARAGAARARVAASRARASANEVDGLVVQISGLVEQTRIAAREAAEHARLSAQAAEEAALHAGHAVDSATQAGINAHMAQTAAEKAIEAMNLAVKTAEVARTAADQRLAQEAEFLKSQARQAREVHDARDNAQALEKQRKQSLITEMQQLGANIPDYRDAEGPVAEQPGAAAAFSGDINQLRQATVAAVLVGGPAVSGAAKTALSGNHDADLRKFAEQGYRAAVSMDERALLDQWWMTDPNEDVRFDSGYYANAADEVVHWFATDEVQNLRKPALIQRTYQLRATGGTGVQAAADKALQANTYDALDTFVNGGGFDKARYEDQLRTAYDLASTGTPEVKAAAEAAVLGDRAGLDEFISIEMYRRGAADAQRSTHDGHINALLQRGFAAAQRAAESASSAQRSYFAARGDAVQATKYAQEAASWSGKAQESANLAAGHVQSAEGSLAFALEQQQRAHTAANQAEADAAQASANADQAASYAAAAHQSANEAASSAASARASAVAAGKDADLAAAAADDAYRMAMEKWHAEQVEIQAANDLKVQAGEQPDQPAGMLETIKEKIGKEALDLILDLIGVTDAINCFKGDIAGCLWTAVNFLPVGKIFKAGKAIGAIRILIGKVPEIKKALEARKIWIADKIEAARSIPACPVNYAAHLGQGSWSFNYAEATSLSPQFSAPRFQFIALKCSIFPPNGKGFRGGHYANLSTSNVRKVPSVEYVSFERHHIIAQSVMRNVRSDLPGDLSEYKGPAIQMLPEDHALTRSFGNYPEAVEYRADQEKLILEGKIDKIYEIEFYHIESLFPGKYTAALNEMLDYALEKGYMKVDFRTTLT